MNIVVLCGGVSTEREISIVSGTEVCKALRGQGHRAILLDVFFGDEYVNLMDAFPEDYDVQEAAAYIRQRDSHIKSALANPNRSFFGANVTKICKMADITFLALHGENGENGKVQASFDLKRIRYTGTGYIGSALCMDKGLTKIMLKSHGIPVPEGFVMTADHFDYDLASRGLVYPVVVKVCNGGSSVGVYIVNNREEYEKALTAAFEIEGEVIVESYIPGREFSIGVIDGEALPVIEIAPLDLFYDYKTKYTPGAAIETCPAKLTGEETKRMKQLAVEGYKALCLDAYARLDFMMDREGNMYCIEANTLPGMTPTSLMPQEARAIGISFPSLCEKLVEASMKKYRKEKK